MRRKEETSYQDPDIPECTEVGISYGPLLITRQGPDELDVGRRVVAVVRRGHGRRRGSSTRERGGAAKESKESDYFFCLIFGEKSVAFFF